MSDLIDSMAEESEKQGAPNQDGLEVVSMLAQEQLRLEKELAELETKAKKLSKELKEVAENKLPTALAEYGLKEIALEDGYKVTIKPFISCAIKEADEEKAFTWLRDNGFGDLIKRALTLKFGKGEDDQANKLIQQLVTTGYAVEDKTGVHASTLKAFIAEQIDAGNEALPKELFNVYEGKRAVIKQ